MKNRRFPFGYEMQNGEIVINKTEANVVKRIFSDYTSGVSLAELADTLQKSRIEYLPCETGWNKSRIKRMLEDNRYLGNNTYPAIIEKALFQAANSEKESRCNLTENRIPSSDKPLIRMVACAGCGMPLFHRTDNTRKANETWYCKTEGCSSVKLSVATVKQEICEILNQLIAQPVLVATGCTKNTEPSVELRRMENELERQLNALDFDPEALQKLILLCAAQKYSDAGDIQHITERLKADLLSQNPLSIVP